MRTEQNYGWLDRFRVIVALLVITNHTSALASINDGADFFLTRVLARIVVPFFLMVTGHFVAAKWMTPSPRNVPRLIKYLRKTALYYGFCILLYLPIGIYAGHYQDITLGSILRMLIFDGTFYHLWYFPACILGMLLVYLMSRAFSLRVMTAISAVLYIIGLFGDSYFGLTQKVPALNAVYEFGFRFFSYTRNGLFLAPLFLVMGIWMAKLTEEQEKEPDHQTLPFCLASLILSFAIMTVEAFLLRYFELPRHDSMYLALVPTMFFLYQCLIYLPKQPSPRCRTAATWIYILHPAFIVVVRALAKVLHLTELLVDNSVLHYLAVTILSVAASFFIVYLQNTLIPRLRSAWESHPGTKPEPESETAKKEPEGSRAWIELDSAALAQNVAFLRSRLPEGCRLMPAVKAEAYGHGAVAICKLLNQQGVDAFCVACLSEGISLREAGIQGEILILGYTSLEQIPLVHRYQLTQAVIDYDYAKALEQSGTPLHVHVAIDTGMHRLGIRCEHVDELLSVFEMKNLIIDGLFTHLSASDSLRPQDRAFTDSQVRAFYQVVEILENQGYACHGLHLLASYGILNLLQEKDAQGIPARQSSPDDTPLPALAADYVRPGIALYGLLSTDADSGIWKDSLRPVLSLKARVASIRMLYAGEAAGYGMAYTAQEDMLIATLSIGYADGLPRELSHGKGYVLINGCIAPVIGRICMDQTLVDISQIPSLHTGDVAVIIGKSGTHEITAGFLAQQCNTITNELLSRLGGRLERIVK